MLDNEDGNNTNIHEQNPLKCHHNELYTNISHARAIFNNHWRNSSQLRYNTYKTSKGYSTTFIGIKTEATCDYDVANDSTFLQLYFVPTTKDGLEEIGYQYNHTTLALQEQTYEYDCEADVDEDDSGDI